MRVILILVVFVMMGCAEGGGGAVPGGVSRPPLTVDRSTPDRAITSYWNSLDEAEGNKSSLAVVLREMVADYKKYIYMHLSDDLVSDDLSRSDGWALEPSVYHRVIYDVDVQTESRAIVFSEIKNVTPIPSGVTLSSYQQSERDAGVKYKYVLQKGSDGWRIIERWRYQDYKEDWDMEIPKVRPRERDLSIYYDARDFS